MALDADGNPHLAYLTSEGQVRHAHSIGGGPWEVNDVGAAVAEATTSIALDDQGIHHIAWQRDVDLAYATNAGGEFAEVPLPAATAGGTRPRLAAGPEAVYLAWYSPQGTRLNMATYSEDQPLLAVPSPSAPPGGDAGGTAECQPEGTELSIAAPPGALSSGFDKDCLAVEAGTAFSITFDNQDSTIHNMAVYAADPTTDPAAEHLAGSEPNEQVPAGESATYDEEPIEDAAEYFFRCDFHPTTMTGTFVVAGQ
jgi:plastocyanin